MDDWDVYEEIRICERKQLRRVKMIGQMFLVDILFMIPMHHIYELLGVI